VVTRQKNPFAGLRRQFHLLEFFTGTQYCDYPITPWCSNGTPDPVLTIAEDTSDHNYWKTFSIYTGSRFFNNWVLFKSNSYGLAGPEAPTECTLTPQPFYSFGQT
jgi:hypothetical protein